ncbi:MAG: hypothetical protein WC781_01215 [Candidatus Pacearchaeota archaeon]
MGMRMGMGLYLVHCQRQLLSQSQKLQLKQIMMLKHELVHPEFPNASKGFSGMRIANAILKERDSVGLLIGGLAEDVWNQRRSLEELASHKDVDVMILNPEFKLEKRFEGGIDWWMPYSKRLKVSDGFLGYDAKVFNWNENLNDVILHFNVKKSCDLKPGLYIAGKEFVGAMRKAEIEGKTEKNIKYDEEVLDKYEERITGKMGKRVPKYIEKEFEGNILDAPYDNSNKFPMYFSVSPLGLNAVAEIRKQKSD